MTPIGFKGIRIIDTIANYNTLVTTGTVTINGQTITYDPEYIYYVKESDTYTKAEVVQLVNNRVYLHRIEMHFEDAGAGYIGNSIYVEALNNSVSLFTPSTLLDYINAHKPKAYYINNMTPVVGFLYYSGDNAAFYIGDNNIAQQYFSIVIDNEVVI